MLGEECFYLTPLPAPKPTNFVLYETRDSNLVKFGNQVKVDQLCGSRYVKWDRVPVSYFSSPLLSRQQWPNKSFQFKLCLMPLSISSRHWGFHRNGSLCALIIKPSLFGYNILSYSARSRAEVELWVSYIFIYIFLYILKIRTWMLQKNWLAKLPTKSRKNG